MLCRTINVTALEPNRNSEKGIGCNGLVFKVDFSVTTQSFHENNPCTLSQWSASRLERSDLAKGALKTAVDESSAVSGRVVAC
jgi:hypothetical protein